jgi:iron complex outermembrane receptor protein
MKKTRTAFVALFLFALSSPFPPPTPAAGEETHDAAAIVVTAARYREGISSVPSKVTVITEDEIRNSPARNIPDLLRGVAAIHVNDIAGNNRHFTVDLRGFGESAALNTLVLVNGRKVNQADLSGTDWTLIPLERVQRIEILHGGAGSVLYGDNATGGVIHIITREAGPTEAGISVEAGSYNTFKTVAWAGGSLEKLSASAAVKYLTSDGYRDNSGNEATDVDLDLSYTPSDSLVLTLGGRYHRDDAGLPGAIKESDFAGGVTRRETVHPDDFVEVEDYDATVGAEYLFAGDSLFKVDLTWRRRDALSFASYVGGEFTGDTAIDTVIVSPQFVFHSAVQEMNNTLTLGFDYHRDSEDITNESTFFGAVTGGVFELEKNNYGLYVQDELELRPGLYLSGGYRYDWADFSFTPSTPDGSTMDENLFMAGANYTYSGKSYAYLGYSRSFRYPVLDEIFNFFNSTLTTDLVSQTTDNLEIGFRHYVGEKGYVHLNLFASSTEDEIYFNPATFTNENLDGDARRRGVEISFDARPLTWLGLNGSYARMISDIDGGTFDGNDVPNVPDHKAVLRALFFAGHGITAVAEGIYVGERLFVGDFPNGFENQESFSVLNLKLEYEWRNLVAHVTVNNATDEEYSEYGALGGFPVERGFFPSPERNFSAGIAVAW